MAVRTNSRSFRYSDRVAEILENFEGDSLNDKFNNLVIYCFDEVLKRQMTIALLDEEIKVKKEKIKKLSEKTRQIDDFFYKLEFVQARVYDVFVALDEL